MLNSNPPAQKRGFAIHAFVFVLSIVVVAVINVMTGPRYWALWVLFGCGIGLLSHWWFVLGPGAHKA